MTTPSLFAPAPRLVACEGCTDTIDPIHLPMGWTATGTSTKRPGKLAIWCRRCTEAGASLRYVTDRLRTTTR